MSEAKPTDLMMMLFERVLNEQPLSDADVALGTRYLFNIAVDIQVPEKEIKSRVKKFRQAIPYFLEKFANACDEIEKTSTKLHKVAVDSKKRKASLPPLATTFDSPKVVDFIRDLQKEYYSYSEAEKLLGVSRQTLSEYARKELYGFKAHYPSGKQPKLKKIEIIDYYRIDGNKFYNVITEEYDYPSSNAQNEK